jgi:hypothetical protein
VRSARDPPVQTLKRDSARAPWQADAVGNFGDGANIGELLLVPGNEQNAILVARFDGKGH